VVLRTGMQMASRDLSPSRADTALSRACLPRRLQNERDPIRHVTGSAGAAFPRDVVASGMHMDRSTSLSARECGKGSEAP